MVEIVLFDKADASITDLVLQLVGNALGRMNSATLPQSKTFTYLLDVFEHVFKVLESPFEARELLHHIYAAISWATANIDDGRVAKVTPRVVSEQCTPGQLLNSSVTYKISTSCTDIQPPYNSVIC